MRFIHQLLPLLLAAPQPAHIVSVINPKRENKLIADDLSLRKPGNYNPSTSSSQKAYLTTFFMEGLAARHPEKLSLIHYYPGLVMTDLAYNSPLPWWAKFLWRYVLGPFLKQWAVPGEESGRRVVFLASGKFPPRSVGGGGDSATGKGTLEPVAVGSDGAAGSGVYRVDWDGESLPKNEKAVAFRADGIVEKVWQHTMTVFEEIEAGRVFTG
jgi:hypothetical protein